MPASTGNPLADILVLRLVHLAGASEETIWEAMPAVFKEAVGVPCDQGNAYHIALAGAVVCALNSAR